MRHAQSPCVNFLSSSALARSACSCRFELLLWSATYWYRSINGIEKSYRAVCDNPTVPLSTRTTPRHPFRCLHGCSLLYLDSGGGDTRWCALGPLGQPTARRAGASRHLSARAGTSLCVSSEWQPAPTESASVWGGGRQRRVAGTPTETLSRPPPFADAAPTPAGARTQHRHTRHVAPSGRRLLLTAPRLRGGGERTASSSASPFTPSARTSPVLPPAQPYRLHLCGTPPLFAPTPP